MTVPVIFVHGLRTSATMWNRQVRDLREVGIPATAIDLPGHGRRIGERFTLDAARAAIDDAVAEAAGRPYLVGASLGGYLAIDWAERRSARICGLLAASCGTVPQRLLVSGWRAAARAIHALPDRGRALHDFTLRAFVPPEGAADVNAGGVALEVMDDVLRAATMLQPVRSLRSIRVPVLLVNGQFDHFRVHARRFLAVAPDARLVTIPRANHMVSLVRPEEFTEVLFQGYSDATATRMGREPPAPTTR